MNTDQNVIDDYTSQLTTNIEDPTSAFLSLDEPSREALSSYSNVAGVNSLAYQIIDYAKNYLGRPYRSGAKGPRAFDCSGFTSFVFRNFDISLSPSSRTQYTQGEQINISDVRPGDLLFFGSSFKQIRVWNKRGRLQNEFCCHLRNAAQAQRQSMLR